MTCNLKFDCQKKELGFGSHHLHDGVLEAFAHFVGEASSDGILLVPQNLGELVKRLGSFPQRHLGPELLCCLCLIHALVHFFGSARCVMLQNITNAQGPVI